MIWLILLAVLGGAFVAFCVYRITCDEINRRRAILHDYERHQL